MVKTLKIRNLDCAHCAAKLQKALSKISIIRDVEVNFLVQKICFEVDNDKLEEAIESIKEVTAKVEREVEFL